MAKPPKKRFLSVDEVLQEVLDSECECSSDSELGDLSSDEEEMIDEGIDPEVDVDDARYSKFILCFPHVNIVIFFNVDSIHFRKCLYTIFCELDSQFIVPKP